MLYGKLPNSLLTIPELATEMVTRGVEPAPLAQPHGTETKSLEERANEFCRKVAAARDAILARRLWQPQIAIVLGSGLGQLADRIEHRTVIAYEHIPGFSRTNASGHAGQLVLGYLAGIQVVAMQGRAHRYEGLTNCQAAFPIHCMNALGAKTLIATNAAGGLNSRFHTGDLMVIDGHLDFLWPRGECDVATHLLRSTPARTPAYDRNLIERVKILARRGEITLHQGCYLATLGPTYETRSEYRMFRTVGADAVGMSTVPEVVAAAALGMRSIAFSVITNVASTDVPHATTHDEVVQHGQAAGPKLMSLIEHLLQDMAGQPD